MSALTGRHGSRKSLAESFPRLTGRSIPLIGNQLLSYDREIPKNEEGVFLTGLLFCNLWKDNNESSIGQTWYDPSFAWARDDPIECVKMYLQKYNVDENRMEQLIESTLKQGYIAYDPVPYVGKIDIRGINGEKLSNDDQDTIVDAMNIHNVTKNYKLAEVLLSVFISGDGDGANWNQLIMGLARSRSYLLTDIAMVGENEAMLRTSEALLRISDTTSNNLDAIVKNMILTEKIVKDDKVIGTIKLTWD